MWELWHSVDLLIMQSHNSRKHSQTPLSILLHMRCEVVYLYLGCVLLTMCFGFATRVSVSDILVSYIAIILRIIVIIITIID